MADWIVVSEVNGSCVVAEACVVVKVCVVIEDCFVVGF